MIICVFLQLWLFQTQLYFQISEAGIPKPWGHRPRQSHIAGGESRGGAAYSYSPPLPMVHITTKASPPVRGEAALDSLGS